MSGPHSDRVVELTGEKQAALETVMRRTSVTAGMVRRVRSVLRAADSEPLDRVVCQVGVDRNVVRLWVDRYRVGGLAALQDRPQPGQPVTCLPSRPSA